MNDVVTTTDLCRLLGVSRETLSKLAKRNIIKRGEKRGTYALQASVSGYSAHLRAEAAGRGGSTGADVRARLGAAQAALTETKARQLAGELVEASAVEALWTRKLRTIRNRFLRIPSRVRVLTAKQNVILTSELRASLEELASDAS